MRNLATRHRRKKRHLAHPSQRRIERRQLLIQRDPQRGKVSKGRLIPLFPRPQFIDKVSHRRRPRLDPLSREADPFPDPGKIEDVDHLSSRKKGSDFTKYSHPVTRVSAAANHNSQIPTRFA